jgi:hypothetical protein
MDFAGGGHKPQPPDTFAGTRHLLYYLWPRRGPIWRWNVEQLLQRLPLFNGRRIICVAIGHETETLETMQELFAGQRIEWLVRGNNARIGEAGGWHLLWNRLAEKCDQDDAIFYGHCRGVKHEPPNEGSRIWTQIMYESCLDFWPVIYDLLKTHITAGSFKVPLSPLPGCKWHYCGTFYWTRAREGLAEYKAAKMVYGGTEMWPGTVFPIEQAGELFNGAIAYDAALMRRVYQEFETWKAAMRSVIASSPRP